MLRLAALSLILLGSGCVSAPELPEWQDIPEASVSIQRPIPLPVKPLAATSTDSTITFDERGIRELAEYVKVAEGNQVIAEENALALEAQSVAYNELLQAGEYNRQIAIIRQETLEQERRNSFVDKAFLMGVILLESLAIAQ